MPRVIRKPTPARPPSISAASTTIHAALAEVRTPAKIASSAEGIAKSTNICHLLALKIRPTSKYCLSTLLMPACVLTTTGMTAPIKTIRIFGISPVPNQIVTSGIHASGGTTRKAVKIGPSSALAFLFHPIKMPKEMPSAHAIASAIRTRLRLAKICCQRLSF